MPRYPAFSVRLLPLLAVVGLAAPASAQRPAEVTLEQVTRSIDAAPASHPRLLVGGGTFTALAARVESDPRAGALYRRLYAQAEAMLAHPGGELVEGLSLDQQPRVRVVRGVHYLLNLRESHLGG